MTEQFVEDYFEAKMMVNVKQPSFSVYWNMYIRIIEKQSDYFFK